MRAPRAPSAPPLAVASLLSRAGLREVKRGADGTFSGRCVPPAQAAFLFRVSALALCSGCVALASGHADLCWVPFSVAATSLLYWRAPTYSWRRYADMAAVQVGLWYQVFRAAGADHMAAFYLLNCCAAAAFFAGLRLDGESRATSSWPGVLCHGLVHVLANVANVALYSGCIPKGAGGCGLG